MTYKVTEEGNISTVFLDGEIDMDVTDKAKEVILPLIDSGKEVHINLKNVSYMTLQEFLFLLRVIKKQLKKKQKSS